jgi:hypothetical protein
VARFFFLALVVFDAVAFSEDNVEEYSFDVNAVLDDVTGLLCTKTEEETNVVSDFSIYASNKQFQVEPISHSISANFF